MTFRRTFQHEVAAHHRYPSVNVHSFDNIHVRTLNRPHIKTIPNKKEHQQQSEITIFFITLALFVKINAIGYCIRIRIAATFCCERRIRSEQTRLRAK